jgi:hypothetical protein
MSAPHEIEGKHRQNVSRSLVLVSCSESKTGWKLALRDEDRSRLDICPSCNEAIRDILRIRSVFTMPDSIAWNRSLTKTVLLIRTARRVLTRITFLMRLTLGALFLGSCCPQASAKVLVHGRILSHRAPYFCRPEHISGLSSVHARSASSSACSFRRQPEWLLTWTSVTVPNHRRSSTKRWYITSE